MAGPEFGSPAVKARTVAGISLVVVALLLILLTTVTVYAIPAAVLALVLGVVLLVRLGQGRELFPAVAAYQDYTDSMKELESKPGPTCGRCQRQNPLGAAVCVGCGASLA
jgi:ABC-type branched-subunit amino acid transport system permease subunit